MNIEEVIQDIVWSNVYYQKTPDYVKLADELRSLNISEQQIWLILQDIRNGEY
jgi:hypothetical protein